MSPVLDEQTPSEITEQYTNDDLDDVFGSAPGSPTSFPNTDAERGGNEERSDVPRLKEKHETEGYRDGVTKGKAESVQAGFDEGYGLGAVLGLRIGEFLGLLDGIYSAVCAAGHDERWQMEKTRIEGVYDDAQRELSTQNVFAPEWWGEDGIWKYDIPGEMKGEEVLFPDVVDAHPLVKKWQQIIDAEVARWGLDLQVMDHEHDNGGEEGEEGPRHMLHIAQTQTQAHAQGREVAAEPVNGSDGLILGVRKKDLNW